MTWWNYIKKALYWLQKLVDAVREIRVRATVEKASDKLSEAQKEAQSGDTSKYEDIVSGNLDGN